ncbi:MAG TPA: helix-turn-helix domain-containing protein, partial [Candidatus Hodarchaeales archaeon]|nr:helix-turn-helix domain-containing protein [Candidatus Hodarchaeales archaeon]
TTARLAELESLQRQVSKFERENKALENNIGERKKEIAEIKDQIVKITNFSQEREKTLKSDLESLQRSTTKDIEVFQSKIKREKELSEFFKRALEVYPKYTVLMILNEVRKATSKELERTIRQTSGGVKRILKELEGEGYVKLSGDEENVEMVKSFPPF